MNQDESYKIHNQAISLLKANSMLNASNMSVENQNLLRASYKAPDDYCPDKKYKCNDKYPYRTISGVCNNLYVPWWGKAYTPYTRILNPAFEDGYNAPKSHSKSGEKSLPNPRLIAQKIHHARRTFPETSHMMIFFNQFVLHDLLKTAKIKNRYGDEKNCANTCYKDDPDCINIPIPKGDYINDDQDCIPLARSAASVWECDLSHREALNEESAWLDLSQVYGNTDVLASKLRTHEYGYLKTSINHVDGYPTLPLSDQCPEMMKNDLCFFAGDVSRFNFDIFYFLF